MYIGAEFVYVSKISRFAFASESIGASIAENSLLT
jgi:hypothetical protein